MDIVYITRELWRRRIWVGVIVAVALVAAVASVYRISLFPPSLTPRAVDLGAASTDILVDAPDSALADVGNNIFPLITRAGVFSRFITSGAVTDAMSRETGIPASEIATSTPIASAAEAADPGSEERARSIVDEGKRYRVQVTRSEDLPLFSVFTQAPTGREALLLANAAATAVASVANSAQVQARTPAESRVTLRQIGRARGGTVNDGVNRILALVVFVGLMIAGCLLILAASSFRRAWRELDAMPDASRREQSGPRRLPPDDGGAVADLPALEEGRTPFADIVADRVESIIWSAQVAAARIKWQARSEAGSERLNGDQSEAARERLNGGPVREELPSPSGPAGGRTES